ncbi:MAG TPA: T9SS type A sorting domain-containing protein, partial [Candidatus Goldiibacteriota bacterium]|nr:T9SS type A sorting domain-containing protein [Candidatus Goldiibacteriota bacterium]
EGISGANTYNDPNPCSENTTILFSLDKKTDISIVIFDITGKKVFVQEYAAADTRPGINTIRWDLKNSTGRQAANGIYILKVITPEKIITKKIAVIR